MRTYGLILGAIVATFIYTRMTELHFWDEFDSVALYLLLFLAVYRIGCVLVGCCHGIPCNLPWAVIYTNPASYAPLQTPLHPTQLYHLLWNAIAFVVVLLLRKRPHYEGIPALIAMFLYSIGNFIIRLFRGDEPLPFGGLSLSQFTSLLFIIASLFLLFFLHSAIAKQKQAVG